MNKSQTNKEQIMMTPHKAKFMIRTKAGTLKGAYYVVGVEVPPRHA